MVRVRQPSPLASVAVRWSDRAHFARLAQILEHLEAAVLSARQHTFNLTVLGAKQAASGGPSIYVDAFNITP
jgi:hypothetical protein